MSDICDNWSDCNVSGGGCCSKGLYGGKPSYGICEHACPHRVVSLGLPATRQDPEPKPKSLISKAISYLKAEASAIISSIRDDEKAARLSACKNCDRLKPSPVEGQIGWCGACGCGMGKRGELTTKAAMPAASCPLGKWPKR